MKLEPLGNFIVIKEIKKEAKTKSGLVLPENGTPSPILKGEVIAKGPGIYEDRAATNSSAQGAGSWYNLRPMQLKVGDVVIFRRQRFEPFEGDDGSEVFLGNEENVWAKVTEDEPKKGKTA